MKKDYIQHDVIVLGGNHHNALGIIRSLGEVGYKINYISTDDRKNNFVSKSRYIHSFWSANGEKKVMEILLNEFNKCQTQKRAMIIPSDDNAMSIIDENYESLSTSFIVPNINKENKAISRKMDKLEMTKIAKKHGFLVPKSHTINLLKVEDIKSQLNNLDIVYPCIIKPLKSIDGSKNDIIICSDISSLFKSTIELRYIYDNVIIQEFIKKDGELGVQGFLSSQNNKVIIPGIIEKIRDSSIAPGSTTYAKLVKANPFVIKDKIESLIKDINYYGIFDLELIFSEGRVYFIEINFRNGAYGYAYTKAGSNIPKMWCLDAIGRDISNESQIINKEITLMNEIADFRNVFSGEVNFFRWLREFIYADVHMLLNIKDIKPIIYKFIYR